jgi:hypothetical protein
VQKKVLRNLQLTLGDLPLTSSDSNYELADLTNVLGGSGTQVRRHDTQHNDVMSSDTQH